MKLTFLLLFSVVVIHTCSAQISAGTSFVGGSASFSRQVNKSIQNPDPTSKYVNSSFNLNPKAGYFIADNVAAGLGINFYSDKTKRKNSFNNFDNEIHSFGLSPFGRYYKMLGERAGFFGQFTISYSKGKTESDNFTTSKFSSIGAGLAPGFVFFATPKIGLETTIGNLGYGHYKTKFYTPNQTSSTEHSNNELSANIEATNIFFGINFYLSR